MYRSIQKYSTVILATVIIAACGGGGGGGTDYGGGGSGGGYGNNPPTITNASSVYSAVENQTSFGHRHLQREIHEYLCHRNCCSNSTKSSDMNNLAQQTMYCQDRLHF